MAPLGWWPEIGSDDETRPILRTVDT